MNVIDFFENSPQQNPIFDFPADFLQDSKDMYLELQSYAR